MLKSSRLVVLLLLAVPFVLSACITVESDLVATPTPAPADEATPEGSPTPAPVITPTPLPTPAPTPDPIEAEVLTFVPYWLLEDAADDLDPSLVTIAAFHSVEASQDGRLVSVRPGRTLYVSPPYDPGIEADIRAHFEACYSISFDNYPVQPEYLPLGDVVPCAGDGGHCGH